MADEPIAAPPAAAPEIAPAAPPAAAPVVEAPVAAAPEAAPATAPEAAPVAPVEAPAAAPAEVAALPTEAPTLLEEQAAPSKPGETPTEKPAETPEAKPAEAPAEQKAEGEQPAAEVPAAPELPPVEYKYEVPEGLALDDGMKGRLHEGLDAFRANPETGAQKLLELHRDVMAQHAQTELQRQHQTFADMRKEWRTEIMADEVLGGAGYQTAMRQVAIGRDHLVSDHPIGSEAFMADLKAFNDFCHITGAGDHPVLVKMLHRAGQFLSEAPLPKVADVKPPPQRPPGRAASVLYDNPRSNPNGRQ